MPPTASPARPINTRNDPSRLTNRLTLGVPFRRSRHCSPLSANRASASAAGARGPRRAPAAAGRRNSKSVPGVRRPLPARSAWRTMTRGPKLRTPMLPSGSSVSAAVRRKWSRPAAACRRARGPAARSARARRPGRARRPRARALTPGPARRPARRCRKAGSGRPPP